MSIIKEELAVAVRLGDMSPAPVATARARAELKGGGSSERDSRRPTTIIFRVDNETMSNTGVGVRAADSATSGVT